MRTAILFIVTFISLEISLYLLLEKRHTFLFFLIALALIIIKFWSLFDAHICVTKSNSLEFEKLRKSSNDPWGAVFISTIWLGGGHIYIGQYLLGSIFLSISLVSSSTPLLSRVVWLISPLVGYHVYINTSTNRKKTQRFLIPLLLLITLLSVSISSQVSSFTDRYIAEIRQISSATMIPTLKENDTVWIDRLTYRFKDPLRGEIIVGEPTQELQDRGYHNDFVARVIGLPGEIVQLVKGNVYINQHLLDEPYLDRELGYTTMNVCKNKSYYFSRREGDVEEIWETTVPPNAYLLMGDNRKNSGDSRCLGTIPREYIAGKATKIFQPLNRMGNINLVFNYKNFILSTPIIILTQKIVF